MEFDVLANRRELLPTLARWYFRQWGHRVPGRTLQDECERLARYCNADRIPLVMLALERGELLGAVTLRFRERESMAEREHWLGGVYVAAPHRGRGLAARLVAHALECAAALGVRQLYLQTEADDGGLYRRLGWQPLERVHHLRGVDVRVMVRDVGASPA